jgi:RNA polymerase sigma factor (sigma-70 family)
MYMIEDKIWSHYKYCYRIAKSYFKSHEEASDIASESICKLLFALKSDTPPEIESNPEPYINQIVINICKNLKRRDTVFIPLDEIEHDIEFVMNHETFDLQMLLETYPEDISKLINMKVSGYSTKECADEFNTNIANIKVRWHRLKKVLKSEFD